MPTRNHATEPHLQGTVHLPTNRFESRNTLIFLVQCYFWHSALRSHLRCANHSLLRKQTFAVGAELSLTPIAAASSADDNHQDGGDCSADKAVKGTRESGAIGFGCGLSDSVTNMRREKNSCALQEAADPRFSLCTTTEQGRR